MNNYSVGYKPLPLDWTFPEWFSPEPKLKSVDSKINKKIEESSKEKFFDPNQITCPRAIKRAVPLLGGKIIHPMFTSAICWFGADKLLLENRCLNSHTIDIFARELTKNPLFIQVCHEVSKKFNIEILTNQDKMDDIEFNACLSYEENKIRLNGKISFRMAFISLIFEMVNAWQNKRFNELSDRAKEGKVDRETYAILFEMIEKATCNITGEIIEYGIKHLNWNPELGIRKDIFDIDLSREDLHPLEKFWQECNIVEPSDFGSHADRYRFYWDNLYAEAYRKQHSNLS